MDAIPLLALLRGVNVGGKNKLPMKALAELFIAAGCDDVSTYIQSGNVLFTAPPDLVSRLPARIAAGIEERFGYKTPVVLRTADQLAAVVAGNPFLTPGAVADEELTYVMFLASPPAPDRVATLDPDRSPPDTFLVRGSEIFLRLPNGAARSKLTNAYFDSRLATTSTSRNWRTVTRLLELIRDQPKARVKE